MGQRFIYTGTLELEKGLKIAIERAVVRRLKRCMTPEERERILRPRSLISYEAILDFLRDESKTEKEIEEFLRSVD